MKHLIKIVPLFIFFAALSCLDADTAAITFSPEEYLHSVTADSLLLPGVGLGKLAVEKTRGEDIFGEHINARVYADQGIDLSFRNSDTLIGITIRNNRVYRTPEGKFIGMNEAQLIRELGTPKSWGTPWKDTSFGILPALNYEGMSVWFGDSTRTIYLFQENE